MSVFIAAKIRFEGRVGEHPPFRLGNRDEWRLGCLSSPTSNALVGAGNGGGILRRWEAQVLCSSIFHAAGGGIVLGDIGRAPGRARIRVKIEPRQARRQRQLCMRWRRRAQSAACVDLVCKRRRPTTAGHSVAERLVDDVRLVVFGTGERTKDEFDMHVRKSLKVEGSARVTLLVVPRRGTGCTDPVLAGAVQGVHAARLVFGRVRGKC